MTLTRLSPTASPMNPPAEFLKPAGEKCSVASAQLVISVARKPLKRSAKSSLVSSIWVFSSRYNIQPKKNTMTTNR